MSSGLIPLPNIGLKISDLGEFFQLSLTNKKLRSFLKMDFAHYDPTKFILKVLATKSMLLQVLVNQRS